MGSCLEDSLGTNGSAIRGENHHSITHDLVSNAGSACATSSTHDKAIRILGVEVESVEGIVERDARAGEWRGH